MHRDAIDGGHLIVTIADVRAEGIDQAVGRALDHLRHCEAIVVDCDIDVIDRAQSRRTGGTARAEWRRMIPGRGPLLCVKGAGRLVRIGRFDGCQVQCLGPLPR